jgi:K(+)-stimulated pyrophosphate-energized sodium pump
VLAVTDTAVQAQLLVWIFLMRVMMVLASGFSYLISNGISQGRYRDAAETRTSGGSSRP